MKNTEYDTTDKKINSADKRRISAKAVFFVCFAIVAATALLICATPIFQISNIEINGNSYYSHIDILDKSGLRIGQNGLLALRGRNAVKILSLRCDAAERAAASACPYIKTVQVRYIPPNKVRIEIEERGKSVVVPYYNTGLLIDDEGIVVDIVRDCLQPGLPVAHGLAVASYNIGKPLQSGDGDRLVELLAVVSALRQADRESEEALLPSVASIDVGDPRNITLSLNGNLTINLGDGGELYYRVSAAKEILARGIAEGEEGSIVFYNGARPVFMPG